MGAGVKVYFLGSGPIAVPVLRALIADGRIELVGVGTQPDRPAGRRREPHPTPVGESADRWGRPAERIESVNAPDFLARLAALAPDIVLVVSFGQLLKDGLLSLPRRGCVNVHGSLLPSYRGAAPIAMAIANGDAATGVAFMQMERGLDSGPVYRTIEYPLDGSETADVLECALGELAARRVGDTLLAIASGSLEAHPQDAARVTVARKMKKEDGHLDFHLPAVILERKVRAFHPWPGAFFTLEHPGSGELLTVSVLRGRVRYDMSGAPGETLCADKRGWVIGAGDGALEVLELVVPGKKAMSGSAFWNGNRGWCGGRIS